MNCPWCGKEMKPGKIRIYGNADLSWESTDRDYSKMERFFGDHRRVIKYTTELVWAAGKTDALHCSDCRKFIFDGWLE